MVENLLIAIQDPQLVASLVDLDTWRNDPWRAAGRLLPDLALYTGGTVTAAVRGARAGSQVSMPAAFRGAVAGSARATWANSTLVAAARAMSTSVSGFWNGRVLAINWADDTGMLDNHRVSPQPAHTQHRRRADRRCGAADSSLRGHAGTWTLSSTGQVAVVCRCSGSAQVRATSAGGAVGRPGVGPVAVGVDVGGDLGAGGLDGLPAGEPGAALRELPEPGPDERLGLEVAGAAAAAGDAAGRQVLAEVRAGELAAVVGSEGQTPGVTERARTAASTEAITSSVRVRRSRVQPATSRVQQSTATCR